MKYAKYLLILILAAASLGLVARPVLAHELLTDGPMGAVLHVDPDDDPLVGRESSFIYEFKYEKGSFDLSQCTCLIEISENGKSVATLAPTAAADNSSVGLATYTFTHPGAYELDMRGTPVGGATFPVFDLHQSLDVKEPAGSISNTRRLALYAVGGVAVLVAIGAIVMLRRKR
jgi:hypothetical protein